MADQINTPKKTLSPRLQRLVNKAREQKAKHDQKKADRLKQVAHVVGLNKLIVSGFAGVNKKGHIVDRRLQPDATPMRENSTLGIPKPKDLPS